MSIVTPVLDRVATPTAPPGIVTARAARTATVAALLCVFEVLDGRRPCDHLAAITSVDVFGQVTAMLAHREAGAGRARPRVAAARLMRVHLQTGRAGVADYFGTVDRSGRVRAVAGRIELVPMRLPGRRRHPELRWALTEFTLL